MEVRAVAGEFGSAVPGRDPTRGAGRGGGRACTERRPKNPENKERRFFLKAMPVEWENAWQLFDPYAP